MTLKPTQEQQAIVEAVAKGLTIKVAALAGTGKTSTLMMIANAYPKRKGLYLAYNKSLQLEAQRKFPKWIDCKTVHGLAYRDFGKKFKKQLMEKPSPHELILELGIEEVSSGIKIDGESITFTASKILAWTRDIVRNFMFSNRDWIEPEDVSWFTQSELPKQCLFLNKEGSFYENNKTSVDYLYNTLNDSLLSYARKLWSKQSDINNQSVPSEHDTYLKLYQLSKPSITGYDYVMLDEAQDANPCIIDILSTQSCQIIYVGDEHQQIYSFRGTINAMKKIEVETYCLTQSFRFGEAIANEANVILECLNSPYLIKGLPSIKSLVGKVKNPYTFIARSNTKLLEECLNKIDDGYKCCFTGDLNDIAHLMRSVFYLWCKRTEWVKDSRVIPFNNWEDLITFAREHEDQELLIPINFIMKHGGSTLDKLKIIQAESRYSEKEADIIFTTAHKAKGREWNNVLLADDFSLKNDDEKNVYYVALTRAKFRLQHTFPNMG